MTALVFPPTVEDGRGAAWLYTVLIAGAVVLALPWLSLYVAVDVLLRFLTDGRLSPLARAGRVLERPLGIARREVGGPAKRFGQWTAAVQLAVGVGLDMLLGWHVAGWVLIGLVGWGTFVNAAFGICLGCRQYALLMRLGVVAEDTCEECADISLRATPATR